MKKYIIISIGLVFLNLTSFAQTPSQIGFRSLTFFDTSRSGRSIPTDIYYPANVGGNNVPLAIGNQKFPFVVFGHGFSLPTSAYIRLADTLTKYGFIVALPTTESGLAPSHENFGKDISYLCSAILELNNETGSFLFQQLLLKK